MLDFSSNFKNKLNFSFLAIAVLIVFLTCFAIYSFYFFGKAVDKTTGNTVPQLTAALSLSEKSAILAVYAPVLAVSGDEKSLKENISRIEELISNLNDRILSLKQYISAVYILEILEQTGKMEDNLTALENAAKERIKQKKLLDSISAKINEIHSNMSDTIRPVEYGSASLYRLLGRKTARSNTSAVKKFIEENGKDIHELYENSPVPEEPGSKPGSKIGQEHVLKLYKNFLQKNNSSISGLTDSMIKEMECSANIKSEGNYLIALLNNAIKSKQVNTLLNINSLFSRSLIKFKRNAELFKKTELAARNPVLAANVLEINRLLSQFAENDNNIFEICKNNIRLGIRIDKLLEENRAVSAKMSELVKELVTGIRSETIRVRKQIREKKVHGYIILILTSTGCLAIFFIISYLTVKTLKRHEYDLIAAKEDAESANRLKSEFLANMSHEIRTPMNAVMGFSEILEQKIRDKESRHYLSLIRSSGKSLLTLINDILDLSKIEAGRMKLDYMPVNPVEIFKDIANIFSHPLSEKGVELFLETNPGLPECLILDEIRFRQILLNLVGNAVKFTDTGSIVISAGAAAHENDPGLVDFSFSVKDTGIGISKDQRKNIFNVFEQHKGQEHARYGGTGLGLAITKRLVEMMGGVISVTGESGSGSTFTINLENVRKPAPVINPGSKKEKLADSIIFSSVSILVADDDISSRLLLISFLREFGFTFYEAKDGQQAVDLARLHQPDIILMDIVMPVMDGIKATEILKTGDETKKIPIIAVTASAMNNDEKKIRSVCDGYLRKPLNQGELAAELSQFLDHTIKKSHTPDIDSSRHMKKNRSAAGNTDINNKRLAELVQVLENKYMPRVKEINELLIMDDVKEFAADIRGLGKNFNCRILTDYGTDLHEYAGTYDVTKVRNFLKEFPGIIREISSLLKN